jgi:cell division transport system permease protein
MLLLTLLTVDILLILNLTARAAVHSVENRVDVTATFKIGTQESTVLGAITYLRSLDQVQDVLMVTPGQALEDFKKQHANDPVVLASLEEVSDNPFGYELIIHAKTADGYPFILEALENPAFNDSVEEKDFSNHEATLSKLSDVSSKIRLAGIALAAIFLLIAILIVFNTVRVTIFIHREEIAIMRLVGATGRFIRWPYLLEALLFSVLATGFSTLIVLPVITVLSPIFDNYFGAAAGLNSFFFNQAWMVFGLEFAGAAAVCVVSTAFAMRKYLKV